MKYAKWKNLNNAGYWFIAPYFIVFLLFSLYPILYTFFLSMQRWDGLSSVVSVKWANYSRMVRDEVFFQSLFNTLRIWLAAFVPQMVVALLLSAVFTLNRIKGMGFFRAVFYLPNLITAASIGLLFNLLLNGDSSFLNQVLMKLHLIHQPFAFLKNSAFTSFTVSYIQWWMWFGYTTIILMAGITAIDKSLYEAAMVDGATKPKIFFGVVIPLLRPTLLYLMVTSIIGGMQLFDVPMVLTDGMGSPDKSILTTGMYIYNQAFKNNSYGYASALAYGLFAIILLFSVLSSMAMRVKEGKQ